MFGIYLRFDSAGKHSVQRSFPRYLRCQIMVIFCPYPYQSVETHWQHIGLMQLSIDRFKKKSFFKTIVRCVNETIHESCNLLVLYSSFRLLHTQFIQFY